MATQLHTALRGARKKRRATTNPHACPHDHEIDEWQIRHHTHKSVAQQELSLSPRIAHACTQPPSANSHFKISFTLATKAQQKNVVGEVDMPQRREAQRKFWSVWCVWHWSDCSWTLLPAAAVSGLCQPPPPSMTDLVLGGSDPPPSMTDLVLGGSDPPPSMTDLALGGR